METVRALQSESILVGEVLESQLDDTALNLNCLTVFTAPKQSDAVIDEDGDENFEDLETMHDVNLGETDDSSQMVHKLRLTNEIVRYRLNKIPKRLSKKEPSPLLKYLLFSNMCSFMHYSQLWNGSLFVEKA